MLIVGFVYFIIVTLIYIGLGAYALSYAKYNSEKSSIFHIIHSLSSVIYMILMMIGYYVFKGTSRSGVMPFYMLYVIVIIDLAISIMTWKYIYPFQKLIIRSYAKKLNETGKNKMTKVQKLLYGCYKPAFNVVMMIWQVVFCSVGVALLISFISTYM